MRMLAPASPRENLERFMSWPAHILAFHICVDYLVLDFLTTTAKLDRLVDHGTRVLESKIRYSSLLIIYKHAEIHFEPPYVVIALVS